MDKPDFKKGACIIKDYQGLSLELSERQWAHITKERGRRYFERSFEKIVDTLRTPDQVRQSTQEKNVLIYEKEFDDLYITNTVLGRAYVNVIVNIKTLIIRTAFPSKNKRKKGKVVWQKKT